MTSRAPRPRSARRTSPTRSPSACNTGNECRGAASLRCLMRRTMLATALVGAALLAGCGKTNTALIPADRASALQDTVNQVQDACNNHDAQAAQSALDEASAQINELPRKVDRRLKANLRDWVNPIERRVDRDCQEE